MRSLISSPSFGLRAHRSLSCPALKLISVFLCTVQKVSGCFWLRITLPRSKTMSPFEKLGATRQLVGRNRGSEPGGGTQTALFRLLYRDSPVGSSISQAEERIHRPSGARRWKKLEELTRCLSQKRGTLSLP